MITKKESASGRSATSGDTNGPLVHDRDRQSASESDKSSSSDVMLEHSYCLSGAASSSSLSSSGAGETDANDCTGPQVLHDERQQLTVIDRQRSQNSETPESESETAAAAAAAVDQQPAAEVSERSRRVRRIPAKFMPDDKLFDDVAEFPHPAADLHPEPSNNNCISANNKKTAKDQRKQKDQRQEKPAKISDEDNDEEDQDEEDDEDDDDDDPYKEYCICRKPHGNRFMIACDHCEDWFHGSCIGISKKQSEQFDSWVCQTCRDNDPSLVPVLKQSAKQNKPQASDKNKIQRRVSQAQSSSDSDDADEKPLRIASSPAKTQRKRNSLSKVIKAKEKNGTPDEFDKADEKEKQRLRDVIEKAKREHAEKVKRRERRIGPLDPTMNQLFQVGDSGTSKSPTKTSPPDLSHHRIKCMICRKQRVNSDKTIFCSLDCIKHHVRTAKKNRHANEPQAGSATATPADATPLMYRVYDAFDSTDVLDAKRKKDDVPEKELVHFLIRNPGFALDPSIKIPQRKISLDRSDSRKSSASTDSGRTPATPQTSHPLKRKSVSEADRASGNHKHRDSVHDEQKSGSRHDKDHKKGRSEDLQAQAVRDRVSKAFLEALEKRVSDADHLNEAERTRRKNRTNSLAMDIEKSLFQLFQSDGKLVDSALKNYLAKYRSLTFNFNNSKNQHLLESLFAPEDSEKHVSPDDVVRMSPEELARGSDLDAWRKIEAKKSLINSVIVSEETSEGPKLKKTRKGEEEIQNDSGDNDSHERFARTPDLLTQTQSVKQPTSLNPLEMILNEINSTSKSSNKRIEVEDVPKSPVREGHSRRVSEAALSPDLPITPEKRRSISFMDEDSSSRMSSRTEVKRVKIAPEITSILSKSTGEEISPEAVESAGREWNERKVLWEGFCSGFEDPNASSSFNPAMNSSSRFPVVCRTLVTESDADPEKLPLPAALNVVGRIAPEQVSAYVQKLVQSSASSESIVEMIPLALKHKHTHLFPSLESDLTFEADDDDDESLLFRENFNKFINYLSQRKRYAVVDVKSAAQSKKSNLKDVYLLPFDIHVTGEAAAVENRSSQLPTKMMADIFDRSAFTQEIRNLKPKKPISILIMLLIKKASSSGSGSSSGASRERSGSSSSTSTTSSSTRSAHRRHTGSRPPREDRITEDRSFTPPPPPAAPQMPVYIPTPISRTVAAVPVTESIDVDEDDSAAYIPGLSPDRNAISAPANASGQQEEDDLRQKALIQMRLLHSS